MTMRFILFLSALFMLTFAPVISVQAQSNPFASEEQEAAQTEEDAANEEEVELDIIEDFIDPNDDKYVEPNLENISKLYWAIGKFDIADDKLIDYYLMINECDMYMQFYHNDFEWEKIQKATREHILNNLSNFPTKFEILSPLPLGRYDQEKEEFEIEPEAKITGLRRLDFAMNQLGYKEICARTGDIYEYPPNIVVILNRPFILEKIPVKRELAKMYIEEAKSFYDSLPPKLQLINYERLAFLRLKIKVTQYKNTVRLIGGDLRAVVFGRLEGFEVYADQDKMKPLYGKNFEDKRFRRLRRSQSAIEASTPTKPRVVNPDVEKVRDNTTQDAAPAPAPAPAAPAPAAATP